MSDLILPLIAFATSLTAAVGGIAGGIVLIAVMPGFLAAEAVIPIHGIVQISSNVSRALLGLRDIEWRIFRDYAAGCVVGALIGARAVQVFAWDNLPLVLGVFILVFTWMPSLGGAPAFRGRYTLLGAFQTALSLFIGVAGPLNMPFLLRENLGRDRTVVTHAVQMTAMHAMKVATFGFLGFAFVPYLGPLAGMVVGATLGSWVGTRIRSEVPERAFRIGVKLLVTFLALRMLWHSLSGVV